MPPTLSDPSTGVYLLVGVLAVLAGFVWLRARSRPALVAFALLLLALAALALCDRLVESPRESAVASVKRAEAKINARDWDGAFAEVGDGFKFRGMTKAGFRAYLAKSSAQFKYKFTFTSFDREQAVYLPDGTVRIGFAGLVEEGKLSDGRFPFYVEAVYGRDPDGVWRARSAEAFDFIQRKTTLSNIPSP